MRIIEPCYRRLGEIFYQARLKKKLTTNELCIELAKYGLTLQRTSITHIEQGSYRIPLFALPPMCKALNLKLNDVVVETFEEDK